MENMVSYDDFEELAETVRQLQSTIQSMEMESNDMMTSWSDMATCVSDIAEKMNPETSTTTTMPETSRERSTTMPETTTRATTTADPTMMPTRATTTADPTMMPTRATTTKEPTMLPTIPPTHKWSMYATMQVEGGMNKCNTATDQRAFRLTYTNVDNCVERCYNDASCMFAVTDQDKWCIGCKQLTQTFDNWEAYVIKADRGEQRRHLSEVEQLRAENAALKAELLKLRRN